MTHNEDWDKLMDIYILLRKLNIQLHMKTFSYRNVISVM